MSPFGISEISVIPVRKEPNEKSEQGTQILFGETFEIIEEHRKWVKVKLTLDQYEGWVDQKMITPLSADSFDEINLSSSFITKQYPEKIIDLRSKEIILLPPGCTLPNFNPTDYKFYIQHHHYQKQNNTRQQNLNIIDLAKIFLNAPYLWGGKNPLGIDCSGFVQVIFKILGVKVARDTNMQVTQGQTINFIGEITAGDLAFFDDEEGNIIHVGIILNQEEIIHASGKVRIDKFDHQGIFNREEKKYTYKLRVIKRII
ncbi:MAG: C40 family peptidase [Bacteroidales bacterium]|jgi:cell wall-associated NlpC family hydrolase|nr:C40 family peptidase [Bacteroidales bacterium]